ncbi:MAG: hypothetical protein CL470_03305 [Acidimicrobiaceae bacterium]|nr:hypothetical protein [Acidimicrobiaceae bacterium]
MRIRLQSSAIGFKKLLRSTSITILLVGCSSASSNSIQNKEKPSESPTAIELAVTHTPQVNNVTFLTMSVHVEGWKGENKNPEKFDRHAKIILDVAHEAHNAGAIFSFELSSEFAISSGAKGVVDELLSLGHAIEVHADVGGVGTPSFERLAEQLSTKFRQIHSLGVTPILVSGICSRGPFVEAALSAGYLMTTGVVEYCLTSLDDVYHPEGWNIDDCPSPSECHGNPGFSLSQKATPWYTTSSRSWTVPETDADFLIVIGESGATIKCLAEDDARSSGCEYNTKDIDKYAQLAESYVLHGEQSSEGRCCVFSTTISIGESPPEGFISDLLGSVSLLVDNGRAVWQTPQQVYERSTERKN